MRITTLYDVFDCLNGDGGEEIVMPEELRVRAVRSIEKMIEYGG